MLARSVYRTFRSTRRRGLCRRMGEGVRSQHKASCCTPVFRAPRRRRRREPSPRLITSAAALVFELEVRSMSRYVLDASEKLARAARPRADDPRAELSVSSVAGKAAGPPTPPLTGTPATCADHRVEDSCLLLSSRERRELWRISPTNTGSSRKKNCTAERRRRGRASCPGEPVCLVDGAPALRDFSESSDGKLLTHG